MSLHNGVDTVAWVSLGLYTKTFSSSEPQGIANLYASLGLIEFITPEYLIAARIKTIRNKGPRSKLGVSNAIGVHTRTITGGATS